MSETKEQWAAVEIMGHRQHVGRIREVRFAGVDMLEIEALERDGTTKVLRYGGSAIFSMKHITEDEARRALVPKSRNPCDTFTASAVLPSACADCGFTREEHEAHAERVAQRALPAHEDEEDEMVDEDEIPFPIDEIEEEIERIAHLYTSDKHMLKSVGERAFLARNQAGSDLRSSALTVAALAVAALRRIDEDLDTQGRLVFAVGEDQGA